MTVASTIKFLVEHQQSAKHYQPPKNLISELLKTKKSHLSIVYYREIYEILWIFAGYHLKSKNSLKRDDTEKYDFSIVQARLSHQLPPRLCVSRFHVEYERTIISFWLNA
jgi:hypothetical protein